jgi:hypothetical protein
VGLGVVPLLGLRKNRTYGDTMIRRIKKIKSFVSKKESLGHGKILRARESKRRRMDKAKRAR